ncbi:NAD(P)/FAD-dependent oxidoreductase [Sandarakinorhabdus sp. DWP1-3-1]|uniref:NAD(P)/FAD-dependent oxidoreductase n=1 Tax=Sandarakinorhabdus sp. DWP1-3-1 TaxID=2804627 RepID=UPI003CEB8388
MSSDQTVICIGAGPAGLTAGYLLGKAGVAVTVLEADPVYVGGISRTATWKGFSFDIGGHRFFSKSQEVEALWDELLPHDFLERPRKSRIFYSGKLFDYPLRAFDALSKLGIVEAARCVLSYARVRLNPGPAPANFEEWVTQRFGTRLFQIFFRTYTEKVWGMKCTEISADWAAQRIKGLSLTTAIWHALLPQKSDVPRDQMVKTLIDSFRYPRKGPGMLWDAAAARIRDQGGKVLMGQHVSSVERLADGRWQVTSTTADGSELVRNADHVISTMPMRELARALQPPVPSAVARAAEALRYRDFLVVALIIKDRDLFDDNWIYIHDPDVKVGRIQNFKSWSPEMVPDAALNCYGMEYFCFEGDGVWAADDAELVTMASAELVKLGLADAADIVEGTVVRQPKAYPVYDADYQDHVDVMRSGLDAQYPGLHLIGRNGMHKYNNQDHAMMTAMLTVRNILAGEQLYDVWQVNQDAEYHEDGAAGTQQAIDPSKRPALTGGELAALASERRVPVSPAIAVPGE